MTVEPRLFLDQPLSEGASLSLDRDASHYLVTVMRRSPGDGVRVFNGRDGEWRAVVAEAGRRSAVLTVETRLRAQRAAPDVHLYFAPVKRARTDFIVEKATELGASVIAPVMTRRTIADRVRTDRLAANVREAAEQTERLDLPQIREPVPLERLIADWDPDRRLIFADEAGEDGEKPWGGEAGRARPILEVLSRFASPPHSAEGKEVPITSPSPSGEGRGGVRPAAGRPASDARTLARARRMRGEPTEPEKRLWAILRQLKSPGLHFRRQAPIGPYIADFACSSRRLVIEADGWTHEPGADDVRDAWLEAQGYRIVRVSNTDIMDDPDGVFRVVEAALRADPHPNPPPGGRESDDLHRFSASPSGEDRAGVPSFAILIGPEGGFDPAERDLLRAQDFVLPVTLGPRILRADTAAAAALTVFQAVLGDWD